MNILLDYIFKVTAIEPTAEASTAFLKQCLLVVKPKVGATEDTITLCTSMSAVAALTDNVEAQQLFNAGMSRIYVVAVDDLDLASILEGHENDFYTIIVSGDFSDAEIDEANAYGEITITDYAALTSGTDDVITIEGVAFTAQTGAATPGQTTFQAATSNDATATSLAAQINAHAVIGLLVEAEAEGAVVTVTAINPGVAGNEIGLSYTDNDTNVGATLAHLSGGNLSGGAGLLLGAFEGVVGISSTDDAKNATRAAIDNWAAFHTVSGNKAKNMCYAFGKLLSNAANWNNQQYVTMPLADDIDNEGDALALFDDRVSFVLDDTQYSKRLAFFGAGGKAIVAPYITKNLEVDMQSEALSYISGNQPQYTKKHATLLQDSLQQVIQSYIDLGWLESGTVSVSLVNDNFVATCNINISEPSSLWRVEAEMRQTL